MEEMFHGLVLESLGVAVKFFRGEAFGGSEHWIFCFTILKPEPEFSVPPYFCEVTQTCMFKREKKIY